MKVRVHASNTLQESYFGEIEAKVHEYGKCIRFSGEHWLESFPPQPQCGKYTGFELDPQPVCFVADRVKISANAAERSTRLKRGQGGMVTRCLHGFVDEFETLSGLANVAGFVPVQCRVLYEFAARCESIEVPMFSFVLNRKAFTSHGVRGRLRQIRTLEDNTRHPEPLLCL